VGRRRQTSPGPSPPGPRRRPMNRLAFAGQVVRPNDAPSPPGASGRSGRRPRTPRFRGRPGTTSCARSSRRRRPPNWCGRRSAARSAWPQTLNRVLGLAVERAALLLSALIAVAVSTLTEVDWTSPVTRFSRCSSRLTLAGGRPSCCCPSGPRSRHGGRPVPSASPRRCSRLPPRSSPPGGARSGHRRRRLALRRRPCDRRGCRLEAAAARAARRADAGRRRAVAHPLSIRVCQPRRWRGQRANRLAAREVRPLHN
jgi:hypothetical protein